MLKIALLILMITTATSAASFAMAPEGCSGDCASCHSLTTQEAASLLREMGVVKGVKMAPVRGLYEVTLEKDGRQAVAYMDYGKKHLMPGPIFSLATRQVVGAVSQPQAKKLEKVDFNRIPLEHSLVMGSPKGKKKLVVFTDPECPFCAKLHVELQKLVAMEPDLKIYVKLFPLKMHPKAYDKARTILGRKSLDLLEKSFAGLPVPAPGEKDRKEPVDESLRFAESIGITSTPTIVLQDGRVVVGFKDAAAIQKELSGAQLKAN